MSQSDLIEHLIQRIRADVRFLHSHDLLSQSARDAILVQLEAVNGNGNLNGNAAVAGLATQMDAASLHHSHQPQPSFATAPSASATSAAASLHSGGRSPIPTPAPPADTRERARALWDYAATQPDDLSFRKGDEIIITNRENEHWYRGYVSTDPSSRQGLFPSNHVETIPADAGSTYGAPGHVPEAHKGALQPYQHQPPPQHQQQYYGAHQPVQPYEHQQAGGVVHAAPQAPPKKWSTPGSFKNTLAHSAVAGGAFGGASAAASSLVHAIF